MYCSEWNPSEQYMTTPKSGFLLRSSIVSGWPGVEVTASTNAPPDPNLPRILRLDQVAEGVLFCLVRGSLETVTFREPREGITFGLSSDGKLKASKSGKVLDVRKDLLRAPEGILDIAKLGVQLESSGSAEMATEMIRKPEQQDINWTKVA